VHKALFAFSSLASRTSRFSHLWVRFSLGHGLGHGHALRLYESKLREEWDFPKKIIDYNALKMILYQSYHLIRFMIYLKHKILNFIYLCFFVGINFLHAQDSSDVCSYSEAVSNQRQKTELKITKLDIDALNAAIDLGGGMYDEKIGAIVPFFPLLVEEEWEFFRKSIATRIGTLSTGNINESKKWHNDAVTIESLMEHAKIAAPYFKDMCLSIAQKTGTTANFGIDNHNLLKHKISIQRKVDEAIEAGISRQEAVATLRDAVRGTLIVDQPEQIPVIVEELKLAVSKIMREAIFINIWEEQRPSGYVGVHAKILFPVYDPNNIKIAGNIIAEVQIHLRCIMDGTVTCVKDRLPSLYDPRMEVDIDRHIQSAASKLLYLSAIKQCPKKADILIRSVSQFSPRAFIPHDDGGHYYMNDLRHFLFQKILEPSPHLWAIRVSQRSKRE